MAVHVGQGEIEQYHVEFIGTDIVQCHFAGQRGFMFKAGIREHELDSARHRPVIFNKQNTHLRHLPLHEDAAGQPGASAVVGMC